ncbi:MAG: methyltransferase [Alphaproteobacteria bacterium]|nr:methyltransferase [Alphaproteobacteria bacterium]
MRSIWKNNVISNFGKQAEIYADHAWIQRLIAQELAHDLPDFPDHADILEIGCGSGFFTQHLIHTYPQEWLHITDVSPEMLTCARNSFPKNWITWSVLDGEADKTGKKYDLIAANMVLHWFDNLKAGLINLQSMLKPEGTLIFSLPGPKTLFEWREVLQALDLPCALLEFEIPEACINKNIMFSQPISNAFSFLKSLKNTGASQGRRNTPPLSLKELRMACRAMDNIDKKSVSWDIGFGCLASGWHI